MACGPNRVPGRCEVPPSNGAPTTTMSRLASARALSVVRGTPTKVMSGPYMPAVISGSGMFPYFPRRGVNQTGSRYVKRARLGVSGTPSLHCFPGGSVLPGIGYPVCEMCPLCHVPGSYDMPVNRPGFDVSVPHPARVWDYWLGGKDNFAADREVAADILRVMPVMAEIARGCRLFLAAAVSYLAAEAGIRQFLDIGTGLPTANNTHELAQRAAPEARVVYVDNDPIVLSHAEARLRSGPHGMCAYVDADARDPRTVLAGAEKILDFSQPIAVIMLGILHYIPDDDDPYAVVRTYLDAVCPGSYLVASHASSDIEMPGQLEATDRYNSQANIPLTLRSDEQFAGFFRAMDLIPPGITPLGQWAPGASRTGRATLPTYTAVARKP